MLDYTKQSTYSSPGKWIEKYNALPNGLSALVKIAQNIIIHKYWITDIKNYGVVPKSYKDLGRDGNDEMNIQTVEGILDQYYKINPEALSVKRNPIDKVIGNCRDFTLLLVSFLRHKGIKARSRSGVATYFTPGQYEDHFVCEYFDSDLNKWVLVDPQLDQVMLDLIKPDFDPLNVPHTAFFNAAESVVNARKNKNPDNYGINGYTGEKYLNYKLFSDIAHINKEEILPWEAWNIGDRSSSESLSKSDIELLKISEAYILNDDVEGLEKVYHENVSFQKPDHYKPFKLEFDFFK